MVSNMGSPGTNFKAWHEIIFPIKQQQHVHYHIQKIWFTALFSQSSSSSMANGMGRKIKNNLWHIRWHISEFHQAFIHLHLFFLNVQQLLQLFGPSSSKNDRTKYQKRFIQSREKMLIAELQKMAQSQRKSNNDSQ